MNTLHSCLICPLLCVDLCTLLHRESCSVYCATQRAAQCTALHRELLCVSVTQRAALFTVLHRELLVYLLSIHYRYCVTIQWPSVIIVVNISVIEVSVTTLGYVRLCSPAPEQITQRYLINAVCSPHVIS